jgi:hypothetical protein
MAATIDFTSILVNIFCHKQALSTIVARKLCTGLEYVDFAIFKVELMIELQYNRELSLKLHSQ